MDMHALHGLLLEPKVRQNLADRRRAVVQDWQKAANRDGGAGPAGLWWYLHLPQAGHDDDAETSAEERDGA
jgi:hypothetical protein